jgi:nitrous oxidase accessory protein NosD
MNTQPENGSIERRDWLNALRADDRQVVRRIEADPKAANDCRGTWLAGLPSDELERGPSPPVEARTAGYDDRVLPTRSEASSSDPRAGRSVGGDWLAAVGGSVEACFAESKADEPHSPAAITNPVGSSATMAARPTRQPILAILLGSLLVIETLATCIYLATRPEPAAVALAPAPQVSASAAAPPKEPKADSPSELIVRPDGDSPLKSLTEALKVAAAGSRIVVHPGRYHERLVLEKPVEIVGVGRRQEIVLEAGAGNTVVLKTSRAAIRGITIEQSGESAEAESCAIDVPGGQLTLEDCSIRSKAKNGIRVHGDVASAIVRRCAILDGTSSGIHFDNGAHGLLEDCDFEGQGEAAIVVRQQASPVLRQCRVNGKARKIGIHAGDRGRGVFEECTVADCLEFGLLVEGNSLPSLRGCTIRGNKIGGEVFHAGAEFEGCSILDNHENGLVFVKSDPKLVDCIVRGNKQGMAIIEESDPHFLNTKIQNSTEIGIFVNVRGRGFFDHCDILDNAKCGLQVCKGAAPRFQDCDFRRNAGVQVDVEDGSFAMLAGTRVHDGAGIGVGTADSAQVFLLGCEVYANKQFGVMTNGSSRCAIEGGSIRENPNSGIRACGGSSLFVANCGFSLNPNGDAFVTDRAILKLERCAFKGGREDAIYINESGSCEADTCTFDGYATDTIRAAGGTVVMRSCTISRSKGSGVFVTSKAKALLQSCTVSNAEKSGVAVGTTGALHALECRFVDNKEWGVVAADGTSITLEDSSATSDPRRAWSFHSGARVSSLRNTP